MEFVTIRVDELKKGYLERRRESNRRANDLIKKNNSMMDALRLNETTSQETMTHFIKDRECSVSIWQGVLKIADSIESGQAARKMIKKEKSRLAEARRVVALNCGVKYV